MSGPARARWGALVAALALVGAAVAQPAEAQATPPTGADRDGAPAAQAARQHAVGPVAPADEGLTIRVAVWHVAPLRTAALRRDDDPRAKAIAEIIQRVRPNVLLLGGIEYDAAGVPGVPEGEPSGQNAARFAEAYLGVAQAPDVAALPLRAFMPPTNSGMPSGRDLDRSGTIETTYQLADTRRAGGPPSDAGRRYSADCWGPGASPGERAWALLVDPRIEILAQRVRTFRLMPWDYVPASSLPRAPGPDSSSTKDAWFDAATAAVVRLSSTNHADVPLKLPNGAVLHALASLPVHPAAEGAPPWAARRNRDEIRFWTDYAEGAGHIVDDAGTGGGLAGDENAIILGSFGVGVGDPASHQDPIGTVVMSSPAIVTSVVPGCARTPTEVGCAATTRDGRRADYILPGVSLGVADAGVWRVPPSGGAFPSEHFLVWMDVWVRTPTAMPTPENAARGSPAESR